MSSSRDKVCAHVVELTFQRYSRLVTALVLKFSGVQGCAIAVLTSYLMLNI